MFSLFLSSDNANEVRNRGASFTTVFPENLLLNQNKRYEVALAKLSMYYSMPNISANLGNNLMRYSPDAGVNYFDVLIPDGTWSIDDIQRVLYNTMVANGHSYLSGGQTLVHIIITANYNTMRSEITITDPNYRLDLSVSTLNDTLGFVSAIYSTNSVGTKLVDIINGVASYAISVPDLVDASLIGKRKTGVIYYFNPELPPGSQLNFESTNFIWYPISTPTIKQITVELVDQKGRIQDLRDEILCVQLVIRERL